MENVSIVFKTKTYIKILEGIYHSVFSSYSSKFSLKKIQATCNVDILTYYLFETYSRTNTKTQGTHKVKSATKQRRHDFKRRQTSR